MTSALSSYYKPGTTEGFALGRDGNPIIQILAVIINVASVFVTALSALGHMEGVYGWIGLGVLALSLGVIFYLKAFKLLVYFSRVIVGGLFIVSGLIKANDPEGFSYKLHDYFQENALDMVWANDIAIYLSILIAVSEILLGVAAIVGGKMKLTSWTLLLMILFFSWLTWFTANCIENRDAYHEVEGALRSGDQAALEGKLDEAEIKYEYAKPLIEDMGGDYEDSLSAAFQPRYELLQNGASAEGFQAVLNANQVPNFWRACVDDCGCFGDALKGSVGRSLVPWESFAKDAVLLYFVLIIFFYQRKINLNSAREDVFLMAGSIVLIGFLSWVFDNWYFPVLFTLLLYALTILIKRLSIRGDKEWIIAAVTGAVALGFTLYTYTYLPIKDYRPYHVGSNIIEKMNDGEEGERRQIFVFMNKETKEVEEYDYEYYMQNWDKMDSNLVHVTTKTEIVSYDKPNSISDFSPYKAFGDFTDSEKADGLLMAGLANDENSYKIFYVEEYDMYDSVLVMDYDPEYYPDSVYQFVEDYVKGPDSAETVPFRDYLLAQNRVILIVSKHLNEALTSSMEDVTALCEKAKENGVPCYVLTSSPIEERIKFNQEYGFEFNYLTVDEIELKIMIRSNPGVIYLESATIKNKWSSRNIPDFSDL